IMAALQPISIEILRHKTTNKNKVNNLIDELLAHYKWTPSNNSILIDLLLFATKNNVIHKKTTLTQYQETKTELELLFNSKPSKTSTLIFYIKYFMNLSLTTKFGG
ncbi:MAG: hypothetical protein RR235_09250, partial [Oscillospiraceae bacterium]